MGSFGACSIPNYLTCPLKYCYILRNFELTGSQNPISTIIRRLFKIGVLYILHMHNNLLLGYFRHFYSKCDYNIASCNIPNFPIFQFYHLFFCHFPFPLILVLFCVSASLSQILELLERESIKWTEEGSGQIIVIRVDKINPKRLSFAKKATLPS